MQSPLKRKFLHVFLLIIILILTLELVLKYSTPKIKYEVINRLEASIHRHVTISDMRIGLFKGVRFDDVKIFGKGTEPAIYIKELSFKFRLLPLLWRKLVITDVSMRAPEIVIMRDSDGKLTFLKLLHEIYLFKGRKWISLSPIGKRRIKGGTITIIDEARELKLEDIEALIETDYFHGTSRLRLGGRLSYPESLPIVNPVIRKCAMSLRGNFAIDVYMESESRGKLKCYGRVDTNGIEGHVYLLTKMDAKDIHLDIVHIRVGDFLIRSHGDIHNWMGLPDFAVQSKFTNLPVSLFNDFLRGIVLGGDVQGSLEITGPKDDLIIASDMELKDNTLNYENKLVHLRIGSITGRVRWTGDSLKLLELTGSQGRSRIWLTGELYGFPEPQVSLNITSSLKDNVSEIITMPQELKLKGEISINADVKGDLNSISITGTANMDKSSMDYKDIFSKPQDSSLRINTAFVLQSDLLNLPPTPPGGFSRASRGEDKGGGVQKGNSIKIESMDVALGSSVTGIHGEVRDLKEPKPNLDVVMEDISLEELKRVIPSLREASLSGDVDMTINIKGTDSGIMTEGKISIADFISGKVKIKDLDADLELYGGELKLKEIRGGFYDGSINGSMDVSFKEQPIRYSSKVTVSEVSVDKLLKEISSARYNAKGKMNGVAYFHGEGLEYKNLKGEGSIEVRNGKTAGLPFFQALADITSIPSFTQFNFESMTSDFKLDPERKLLLIENLKIKGRDANFYIDKARVRLDGGMEDGILSAEIPRRVLARSNKFGLLLFLIGERSSNLIFDFKLGGFLDNPRLQWMEGKLKNRIEDILTLGQKEKIQLEIKRAIEALTK